MTRRDDSLIGQVVAANVLLVALTLLAASLVAGLDLQVPSDGDGANIDPVWLDRQIDAYYSARGWDHEGRPAPN